jgi:hypothetical protein
MMRSSWFGKSAALVATLFFAVPVACSNSESDPGSSNGGSAASGAATVGGTPASGGSAGSGGSGGVMLPPGTSETPKTIQCGGDCSSARVGLIYVDPCCSGANSDVCGIDTTYLATTGAGLVEGCEPKDQPGELNEACPSPDPAMIGMMGAMATLDAFPGCCRPNGTCGVAIDTVTAAGGLVPVADLGLGCVDAAMFFPGEAPVPCSDAGGAGGAGGAAGAAGATSDGSGGAP